MIAKEKVESFFSRIDKLTLHTKPKYGQMNVHQMVCHCTDGIRMAFGEKKALEYGNVDFREMTELMRAGKTVPAPKGFDQVKGEGTKPVDFNEDRATLKKYITKYADQPGDFKLSPHPYKVDMDRNGWDNTIIYHLDHHLKQFGV